MHTHFLIVIKYTSGEFRDKMGPVLRLTVVVVVVVFLSAGPAAGIWYSPESWLQSGRVEWSVNVFQQQQIYLLEMQVNELKKITSQQQQEIDLLKPLLEKVRLLEGIIGVNLTGEVNLTDFQPTILERLTMIEGNQTEILAQQEIFRQQHALYNESIQNLTDHLQSVESEVNINTGNITRIDGIVVEHGNSLSTIQDNLTTHGNEIDQIKVDVKDIETQLGNHNTQLEKLQEETQEIPGIKDNVTSLQDDVHLLSQPKQVGFSARYSMCGDVDLGVNGPVKYDIVDTNMGGGYSNETGCFTATEGGLYVFFTSLRSTNSHGYVTVGIFQNDKNLMEATADGKVHPWNRGSALVTTHLDKGDDVCVKHAGGWTFIDANNFTSFSGWLVEADL